MRKPVTSKNKSSLLLLAAGLLIYGVLVFLYLFLVIHLLSDWILQINEENQTLYAFLCVLLIAAQGLLLESLTTAILKLSHPKSE